MSLPHCTGLSLFKSTTMYADDEEANSSSSSSSSSSSGSSSCGQEADVVVQPFSRWSDWSSETSEEDEALFDGNEWSPTLSTLTSATDSPKQPEDAEFCRW